MTNLLQPVLDWIAALPPLAQMSLIAILISLIPILVSLFALHVSRQQAATSKQSLFVGLLEKRVKWLGDLQVAVGDRMVEIRTTTPANTVPVVPNGQVSAQERVRDSLRNAQWLFDDSVVAIGRELSLQLDLVAHFHLIARAGKGDESIAAESGLRDAGDGVDVEFSNLIAAAKPFLYVGDVKRPQSVVKQALRLGRKVRSVRLAGA